MLISLTEYAARQGVSPVTVRQKAAAGRIAAVKIGKTWAIDEDTPYIDNRIKSGKYKAWRKDTRMRAIEELKAMLDESEAKLDADIIGLKESYDEDHSDDLELAIGQAHEEYEQSLDELVDWGIAHSIPDSTLNELFGREILKRKEE